MTGPEQAGGLGRVGHGAAEPAQQAGHRLDVEQAEHPHRPARRPEGGDGGPQAVPGDEEHGAVGHVDGEVERHPLEQRRQEGDEVGVEPPRVGLVRAVEPAPDEAHATARRWATGAHS